MPPLNVVDDHPGVEACRQSGSVSPRTINNPQGHLVWIVFGGTGRIGRSIVQCALTHGDSVVTVGRELGPDAHQESSSQPRIKMVGCDIRDKQSVSRVVRQTILEFGRINVVANCTGYRTVGSCEDQGEQEIRDQFETIFMGTVHMMQAVLPHFRLQNGGRFLFLGSTAGALGTPGLGPHCAAQSAVQGLVEAMTYETESAGVKTTLIELGRPPMGSDLGGDQVTGRHLHQPYKGLSSWYTQPTSPALHVHRMVEWMGDSQFTNTAECARLVWQLAHAEHVPLRLMLGSFATNSFRDRTQSMTEEVDEWKHLNFPSAEATSSVGTVHLKENKKPFGDGFTESC